MKYKIGDKVRVKNCLAGLNLKGKIGKVIAIGVGLYNYGIEFDEPIAGGHDCGGRGKCGCCRWGYEEELEPVGNKKIVITAEGRFMKYKVGDKVRVRKWDEMEKEFGLDKNEDIKCKYHFTKDMKKFCGKIFTVDKVYGDEGFYVLEEGEPFLFSDDMLEPVSDKKIVITADGKTTLARLYEGKKVVKTAKAICSPEDEFDFVAGAELAFERLFKTKPVEGKMYRVVGNTNNLHYFPIGEKVKCIRAYEGEKSYFCSEKTGKCQYVSDCDIEAIVEPTYYSGKVVCVKASATAYTVGKVYEFIDGKVRIDNGCILPSGDPIKSLDEWNDFNWTLAKFIELKE